MSQRLRSLVIATTLVLAAACGSGGTAGAPDAPPIDRTTDSATAAVVASLPADLKVLYTKYAGALTETPYSGFGAVKTPWKWCHSESFQGNPWRVAVTNELKRLTGVLQAAGTVSSFEVADSNNSLPRQISQIQKFVDDRCSVITTVAGSATGLDAVIDKAYAAGIPVVTLAGAVTSKNAINVDSNYYRWGYDMATAIGNEKTDAKVLVIDGIAGNPIVAQESAGLDDALKDFPRVTVVAKVNGNWSPDTTKQVVLQALTTNPGTIDAVWSTGSESKVIAEAFQQAGRPVPLITSSISGDALGYWKAEPQNYRFSGNAVLPVPTAQAAFRVAVRVLEGQKPKLNTLLAPLPAVTQNDLGSWYKPCMTPASGSVFPVPPADPIGDDEMNAYFADGKATPQFDYATTPDPCNS